MSNSPSTFRGEGSGPAGIEWGDSAELHKAEDGGVMNRFKTIRRGTFAELVTFVMSLPEANQPLYSIAKAGDRRFQIGEIRDIFRRSDFPGKHVG